MLRGHAGEQGEPLQREAVLVAELTKQRRRAIVSLN
jgi:hypothetical protein